MVYGELGRYPLDINIQVRVITFWAKLVCSNCSKLNTKLYNIVYKSNYSWSKFVKSILNDCGLSYAWNKQYFNSVAWLRNEVRRILIDQFIQSWRDLIFNSPKGLNYRMFKDSLELEKYLLSLPTKQRNILYKFRTCNIKLPTETGRWLNIPKERKCNLSNFNNICDEFHYLFECSDDVVTKARNLYIPRKYNCHACM